MRKLWIILVLALGLVACNHGNASASGNDGGGEAPAADAGPAGPVGAGKGAAVGADCPNGCAVPRHQVGPQRPKGNLGVKLPNILGLVRRVLP